MRRLLLFLSPWHRGYLRGYEAALQNVESAVGLAMDMAAQYGQATVDDAARAIARALSGRRDFPC